MHWFIEHLAFIHFSSNNLPALLDNVLWASKSDLTWYIQSTLWKLWWLDSLLVVVPNHLAILAAMKRPAKHPPCSDDGRLETEWPRAFRILTSWEAVVSSSSSIIVSISGISWKRLPLHGRQEILPCSLHLVIVTHTIFLETLSPSAARTFVIFP